MIRAFPKTVARKYRWKRRTRKVLERRFSSSTKPAICAHLRQVQPGLVRATNDISWARKVVAGLRGTNDILERQFDAAAQAAELSVAPALWAIYRRRRHKDFCAEHQTAH